MSETLLRSARAEEARLRAEIEAHPTYRKLEAIRQLIALYDAQDAQSIGASVMHIKAKSTFRPVGQSQSVIDGAKAFFIKVGRRAQTQEILDDLIGAGYAFTSNNPVASLSSALSHHDDFDNKRGLGYGLTEWNGGDGPNGEKLVDGIFGEKVPYHPSLDPAVKQAAELEWSKALE